jgi:UDP-N-acetylglucosamine 1-carboxyvinyltransferase
VLIVEGGHTLHGSTIISGFKHALVTTIAAGLVCKGQLRLTNVPRIAEADCLEILLRSSGASVSRRGDSFLLDSRQCSNGRIQADVSGKIHGSIYLVPGLLRRCGGAVLKINGGCQIGSGNDQSRPYSHYLEVLHAFGAEAAVDAIGQLHAQAKRLRGCDMDLDRFARRGNEGNLYSGATKMALLCAAAAAGRSTLANPYLKADVLELIEVLDGFGVRLHQGANGTIVIEGISDSAERQVRHELGPDLVEVVTWITAAALYAREPFTLNGSALRRAPAGLRAELELFAALGVEVRGDGDRLVVSPFVQRATALDIIVGHKASIFSDSHPFFALLAMHAAGTSRIVEEVWPDRFSYIEGLVTLGGRLRAQDGTLLVDGPWPPRRAGNRVRGHDLRAAAVLLLAALGVPGTTYLMGASHLRRGYTDLPGALRCCGARIRADRDEELVSHDA